MLEDDIGRHEGVRGFPKQMPEEDITSVLVKRGQQSGTEGKYPNPEDGAKY